MQRSQIQEQGVVVLSAICKYNTFQEATAGWLCFVFLKKAVFNNEVLLVS